jgi:hypothetical protein
VFFALVFSMEGVMAQVGEKLPPKNGAPVTSRPGIAGENAAKLPPN